MFFPLRKFFFLTAASAALLLGGAAQAQKHPWLTFSPKMSAEAYFSNVVEGQTIETPFLLKFGLTGIGISAITKAVPKTGHHHLLVDRELPMDFNKALPFSEQYIHFGAGQMEKVLEFPPGQYTLRLVFADHRHIPNFVYSPPVTIRVAKHNKDIDPKSLLKPKVEILSPQNAQVLRSPMRIIFHATGMNVSHTDIKNPNTGHFRLRLSRAGAKAEQLEFPEGNTEAWLNLPAGSYSAELDLIDNNKAGQVLRSSPATTFSVAPR